MPLFLLCSMISGFGGGAIFPMFAAMTADYFGENNNASNYGMVYSSKLVSGLPARAWAPWWSARGATTARSGWPAASSLFAGVVALFLHPPGRPRKSKITPNPKPISREVM